MAKDWFREQVLALGAEYKVNATGSQFALFKDLGEDPTIPPIAVGSHLDSVATGGKFDGPLGVGDPQRGSLPTMCWRRVYYQG